MTATVEMQLERTQAETTQRLLRRGCQATVVETARGLIVETRRFPPPWSAEETEACYIVRDANGQALAYVYYEQEPGRRAAAHLLTRDEAWCIALNIAKLPQGAAAEATGLYRSHFRYDLNYGHFAGLRSLTSWAKSRNERAYQQRVQFGA